MSIELPDWLRGVALLGKFGGEYLPVATDESGQLYIVLTGSPEITIPGDVNVNDLNTLKQIQGTDGTTFRTAKLNANGEFIIVPRGASGNYLAVDASGFMTTIMKGLGPGATLTTIAADASGQLIMVPRGQSGNYMNVDASGFLSTVMKGADGATLRTVAVDAAGNIVGVLKGETGAGLQTLKVDSEGRIFAYLQDGIDQWGNVLVGGLAELATRLGAQASYERRGQVIFQQDFSYGPGAATLSPGAGGVAEISPVVHYHNGYSVKLQPAAVLGRVSSVTMDIGALPAGQRIGLGMWIKFGAFPAEARFQIQLYDGANFHNVRLTLEYPSGKVYLSNSVAGQTEVAAWYKDAGALAAFRFVKFVINMSTFKYERIIVDGTQTAVTAVEYQHSAAADKLCTFFCQIYSDGTYYGPVYIGSVILTSVEPAN